ncbi:hypothetical protein BpOF4_17440 [Alkalihalophilus pseudofirmus OF4]|uniref:Lipoprotein n=1 Tax=Alkalihalophilus pseudofirmus (strain ATCC BAA-2126 / JCM 17055 / OF4) TaxID=398511 RepID=D3FRD8_ALKPO|nr:hypothetical protein [Alkalihalophilus pseudofirmus]ADC51529.1 hypothetical protein BpOF4_17440 [Alkalihalophilus pseudofirmus OF4]
MNKILGLVVIIFLFVGCSFLFVGCSIEERKVVERLKPEEENKLSVRVFVKKTPSKEYQRSILNIFDEHSLWGDKVTSHGFTILDENSTQEDKYNKIFVLDRLPEIFVFNHQGVIFRTYEVDELETFLISGKD